MNKQRIVIKNIDKNTKRYKLLSGLTHISIKNRRYRADIIEVNDCSTGRARY